MHDGVADDDAYHTRIKSTHQNIYTQSRRRRGGHDREDCVRSCPPKDQWPCIAAPLHVWPHSERIICRVHHHHHREQSSSQMGSYIVRVYSYIYSMRTIESNCAKGIIIMFLVSCARAESVVICDQSKKRARQCAVRD